MKEKNAYILGTDQEELHRLGVQHQIWASEAHTGWEKAGFNAGDTLLDLGCGPGFCTKELSYIVGDQGKVIGIDKSEHYIQTLRQIQELYQLPIEAIAQDFNDMHLAPNSIDGMYCRWALAWLPNPIDILKNVYDALKPGGAMVIHEYFDWSVHQIEPQLSGLTTAINACYRSFKDQESDIDVGRFLPIWLREMGCTIESIRPMQKMARVESVEWQWPATFYRIYFPKLVESGYLTKAELQMALRDLEQLEHMKEAIICCPLLIEVVASK